MGDVPEAACLDDALDWQVGFLKSGLDEFQPDALKLVHGGGVHHGAEMLFQKAS